MADAKFLKPDTLALHAGQHPDPVTGARAVPIYQTTSFVFRDVDHAASLFNLEVGGHIYSRISTPPSPCSRSAAALEEGPRLAVASAGGAAHRHRHPDGRGQRIVASIRSTAARAMPGHRCGSASTIFVNGATTSASAKPSNPKRVWSGRPSAIGWRGARHSCHRRHRPPGEDSADDRQHLRLAGALPAAQPGRRHRVPLGHQVHRRSWRGDRRRDRRIGPLRLGRLGQVPDPHRALCRLSRHRLRRGIRPARLRHAPVPRACATSAPAWRRKRRSTCCKDWRRCRCASRATSNAQGHCLQDQSAVERIASPERDHHDHALARGCCRAGSTSASTSRVAARPAGASSSG